MTYIGALQSALFYFLCCTPCHELVSRQKTKKQAKKEKKMHQRIIMDQPHLYRHPEPFQTNPYWAEEIRMGPSLPRKRKGSDPLSKTLSQRRLTTASRDGRPSMATTASDMNSLLTSPRPSYSPSQAGGRLGSSPTVVPEEEPGSPLSKTTSIGASTAHPSDWNMQRYQREDEELWGYEQQSLRGVGSGGTGHKLMDAIKHAGTSAGRYMESKLAGRSPVVTDEDRYNFYYTPRNPPVNEYHPPVVSSKPANKEALRWMLQPPPPAKVMEGKVPVARSASGVSQASSRSRRTAASTAGRSSRARRPTTGSERSLGEQQKRWRANSYDVDDDEDCVRPSSSRPSVARTRSRMSSTATTARTRSRRSTAATTIRRRSSSTSTTTADSEVEAVLAAARRQQSQKKTRSQRGRNRRVGLGKEVEDMDGSDTTEEDEEKARIAKTTPGATSSSTLAAADSTGSLSNLQNAGGNNNNNNNNNNNAARKARLPTIMSSGGGDDKASEEANKGGDEHHVTPLKGQSSTLAVTVPVATAA